MNRTLEDLITKVIDNYDKAKENDMRFLVILEDNDNMLIIPEDGIESYDSKFFVELRKFPNYQYFKIKTFGLAVWILADPLCENELAKQVQAFLNEQNRHLNPETEHKFLINRKAI